MTNILISPIGPLRITATTRGISEIKLLLDQEIRDSVSSNELILRTRRELTEYFEGSRNRFTVPLDLSGTPFQLKVWNYLYREIAYGATSSYGAVAAAIGHAGAARAVGSAAKNNPILIIVPCHRLIAANGSLGGFMGRANCLSIKETLLELERSFSEIPTGIAMRMFSHSGRKSLKLSS